MGTSGVGGRPGATPGPAAGRDNRPGARFPRPSGAPLPDLIQIRGAHEHNLRHVDLDLPKGRLVVFCGVSGSGKSSLAFDTLYAEAHRRFVEALSPGLRSQLGALRRPAVDYVAGLLPAIGVSQRGRHSPGPRATVGTTTDVHDLLRVLWARAGVAHCTRCGRPAPVQTPDGVVRALLAWPEGTRLTLLAPVARGRKGALGPVLDELRRGGFARVRVDGQTWPLDEVPAVDARLPHDVDVVVDRLKLDGGRRDRLLDSVGTTLAAGRDALLAELVAPGGAAEERSWATRPRCAWCDLDLPAVVPRLFSFNTKEGACARCEGLGEVRRLDEAAVVVDPERTLGEGALEGGAAVQAAAGAAGISLDRRWRELPWQERDFLLHGGDRPGGGPWEGALALLLRKASRPDAPERLRRRLHVEPCPDCAGARLGAAARAVRLALGPSDPLDGASLPELLALPLDALVERLAPPAEGAARRDPVSQTLREELSRRVRFLVRAGLGHLSLDRATASLSTGELQRVRLGAAAGNQLSGVLYVLDEPTAGLHPADIGPLLGLLRELVEAGNSVVLAEHDPATVAAADLVVEIGPGAGAEGGRVLFVGPPEGLAGVDTPTARWLGGRDTIPAPAPRTGDRALHLRGARGHNLRGIDVRFPLGRLVGVGGVSGAGKSSLVEDTLGRALAVRLHGAVAPPLPHDGLDGAEPILRVVRADAAGVGRSARSTPASVVKVWDAVRALYARTNEAKLRGWGPERFSLAVPGGRCEACSGEGVQRVDLHYLPGMVVPCEVCDGQRFEASTLAVTWKGASVADVLAMPVRRARELFAAVPAVAGPLAVLDELGLGYVPLGQPTDGLSGGEAQRLALARELARPGEVAGTLYLLDEPSVGLHPADVAVLVHALRRLVDAGGSVVAVEHDPLFLGACDHLIVLGPGAGARGGELLYAGPPAGAP